MKRGVDSPPFQGDRAKTEALSSLAGAKSPRDLEYFQEARFFLGENRATLTFYAGSEVTSIHYDRLREEIFLKGHNVKNMTLTEEQWLSLQHFADYLAESSAYSLLRSYESCLHALMQRKGSFS